MAASAVAAPLTPQHALDLREAAEAALSPDGAEIVYRMNRPRTASEPFGGTVGELWSIAAAGGEARRFDDTGFDAQQPQWSPDGRQLAWTARSNPTAARQLYLRVGRDTPTIVSNAPAGVETYRWSPDSRRIAFTAFDAPSPERARDLQQGRDWVVFDEPVSQLRLHVLDLGSRRASAVTGTELTVHDFDWSADGERFVLAAAPTPWEDDRLIRSQLYVVDVAGGTPRLLSGYAGRISHPRWSSDGKSLAWLASTSMIDPWAGTVFVMSLQPGATPRALTREYAGSGVWLGAHPARAGVMLLLAEERQNTVLHALDLASGQLTAIARGQEILSGPVSVSRDGRSFAAVAHAPTHPGEIFVGRIPERIREQTRGGTLRRLTYSNAALAGIALGAQSSVRWRSVDGLEIEGVLIKPVGFREGVRYPVILSLHGGSEGVALNGWQGGTKDFSQLLAARGYLVLHPNYRGSRGRGAQFAGGNRGDVMGREFEDTLSGLDHLVERGLADGARAGIYGFSWGGYAAGWGATFASERFKAAVANAGIYNWISEAGSNDTRLHEQLAHWDAPLYENFSRYLERSPIYEIRRAGTPLLLLHGERDESCPLGQAIEFHTALKWRRVPVQLVIYPREGHGLREPAHQLDALTRTLAWFDRYLGATP